MNEAKIYSSNEMVSITDIYYDKKNFWLEMGRSLESSEVKNKIKELIKAEGEAHPNKKIHYRYDICLDRGKISLIIYIEKGEKECN